MKTIKIKYVGYWPEFDPEDDFYMHQMLKKHYDVQMTDDPDYIICSCFDEYSYVDYPQIRIMACGENYVPDFNLIDYGVTMYPIEMLDRHFSFPGMVGSLGVFWKLMNQDRTYPAAIMEEKTMFANSIFSHESDNGMRSRLVQLLSQYKRVESPGPLMYNMPNGEKVSRLDGTKELLQRKTKFTLCCESTCQSGFITEKIFEAFAADTIPVYLGSNTITDIVNKDAFINLADYDNLEDVLKLIIQLDQDDEAYLKMLRQPVFNDPDYLKNKMDELEAFICNIFDQPLEQAYRRSRVYYGQRHENWLKSRLKNDRNRMVPKLSRYYEAFAQKHYKGRGIVTKLKKIWR